MTYKISGEHAVRLAERDGVTLKQGECGQFIEVEPLGWVGMGDQNADCYHVEDYFSGGQYLGPDCDGTEPTWIDAT